MELVRTQGSPHRTISVFNKYSNKKMPNYESLIRCQEGISKSLGKSLRPKGSPMFDGLMAQIASIQYRTNTPIYKIIMG